MLFKSISSELKKKTSSKRYVYCYFYHSNTIGICSHFLICEKEILFSILTVNPIFVWIERIKIFIDRKHRKTQCFQSQFHNKSKTYYKDCLKEIYFSLLISVQTMI